MFHTVKEIIPMRSTKRDKDTNEMIVHTLWNDGSISFEPLSNFYNGVYYNLEMDEIITRYKKTAMDYPKHKRKCLSCNNKVSGGMIFCCKNNKCVSIKQRYE